MITFYVDNDASLVKIYHPTGNIYHPAVSLLEIKPFFFIFYNLAFINVNLAEIIVKTIWKRMGFVCNVENNQITAKFCFALQLFAKLFFEVFKFLLNHLYWSQILTTRVDQIWNRFLWIYSNRFIPFYYIRVSKDLLREAFKTKKREIVWIFTKKVWSNFPLFPRKKRENFSPQ